MNKKGFTLIELLGVVTIIALLSLIILHNITSNINKKKVEISEVSMNLLSGAADTYIENNPKKYSYTFEADGSTYCIPLQTLVDSGNLESPFRDVNGREVDYSNVVKAIYVPAYNGFSYEIVPSNSCSEVVNYVNRPQLADGMIPVYYDSTDNVWKKSNISSQWYSYSDKRWANAVLVKELKSGENSKSRKEYEDSLPGTVIAEDDILAYFVWIPRFRYQLFSSNSPVDINIIFEDISTPKSQGTTSGQWLTHPAFSVNGKELPGVWVGKYRPSGDNIIIKSSQTALTNVNYVDANEKALSMVNEGNIYGLKDVNTHVIKNSEWGAVVYLTKSIYGNYSNDSTTGNNTGIYELASFKQFVVMDNENENSLGYSLGETKNWVNNNTYPDSDNLYLTRGNSSIFSYNKSKVADSNTSFRVAMTNTNIQNQEYKQKYIVTFDPNGGTVDTTSKEVTYGDPYGELPVPTREGYTFVGWNGRNYYDVSNVKTQIGTSVENDFITFDTSKSGQSSNKFYLYYTHNLNLLENTRYVIAVEIKESINATGNLFVTSDHEPVCQFGSKSLTPSELIKDTTYVFIKTTNTDINKDTGLRTFYHNQNQNNNELVTARISVLDVDDSITENNFEYEPYYITSSTNVVQDRNHTLKAIWKANS